MKKSTTSDLAPQVRSCDLILALRARVREAIEAVIDEELTSVLGCVRGERSADRAGFRHSDTTRDVVTQHGPTALTIPRGRVFGADGTISEWRSSMLPRYQRRTRQVDAALLGTYVDGGPQSLIEKTGVRPSRRGAPFISQDSTSCLTPHRPPPRGQKYASRISQLLTPDIPPASLTLLILELLAIACRRTPSKLATFVLTSFFFLIVASTSRNAIGAPFALSRSMTTDSMLAPPDFRGLAATWLRAFFAAGLAAERCFPPGAEAAPPLANCARSLSTYRSSARSSPLRARSNSVRSLAERGGLSGR